MKTLCSSAAVKIMLCALTFVLGGCSSYTLSWPLANFTSTAGAKGSVPDVQNCLNVNGGSGAVSTPEYVCNGKTYTSRQLRQLRQSASEASSSHS